METLSFVVLGSLTLGMALAVVLARSPLRAALALIVTQCALAGLYVGLSAPFVAAMQVLVYAGAIMVLFLFVIMLLNLGPDTVPKVGYLAVSKVMGALGAAYIAAVGLRGVFEGAWGMRSVDGGVHHLGTLLLGPHLVSFEAISVLLLAASLGTIVLGLKRLT